MDSNVHNQIRRINNPSPETRSSSDWNNNYYRYRRSSLSNNMDNNFGPVSGIPPVTTCLAFLQISLFYGKEWLGIKSEEDVFVSWSKVIQEKEFWRLSYAHFFNFQKVPLFINCLALVSVGRYLEKRVQRVALIVLIEMVGITTNFLYILLNSSLCSGSHNEQTYGFNSINYGLRFWLTYLQEPLNYQANMLFGFWSCEQLPTVWAPWPLCLEVFLIKFLEYNTYCATSSLMGILVGAFLAWFMWKIPESKWYIENEGHDEQGPSRGPSTTSRASSNRRHFSVVTKSPETNSSGWNKPKPVHDSIAALSLSVLKLQKAAIRYNQAHRKVDKQTQY